jgi:GntR family transcriptional regulator
MTYDAPSSPDQQMPLPVGKPGGQPYEWVAEQIAARIKSGDLGPNTPLPAERRLAQEYGVSLGTARQATRVLRERGLVVTLRSKGTYVADRIHGR